MLPDTPLIMLPGICCDGWFFRHQAHAFSKCGDGSPRHVIVPDWAAHVDPRDGTGALQRLAGRLSTAWHEARLDGAVVVGHSMGGTIAALACGTGRFQPSALLLLDSSTPVPPDRRPFLREMGQRIQACANSDAAARRTRMGEVLREYVFQHLASPADDRGALEEIVERMSAADPERNGVLLQAASVIDVTSSLKRVPGRVVALAGDPSRIPIDLFLAARPDADIAQLPRVGHFLQVLAPEPVNTAIACVLRGEPLRGAGMESLTPARAHA